MPLEHSQWLMHFYMQNGQLKPSLSILTNGFQKVPYIRLSIISLYHLNIFFYSFFILILRHFFNDNNKSFFFFNMVIFFFWLIIYYKVIDPFVLI